MLTELETEALRMLLAGEHRTLVALRNQLAVAHVSLREFSSSGFFTHFGVPDSAPRLENQVSEVIGDVYAKLVGLECDVGFLLFVNNGALDMLECFSFGDGWSTEPTLVRAYYVRPKEEGSPSLVETTSRDLEWVFSKALPNKALQTDGASRRR